MPGADGKPAVVRPAYNNVAQWPAGSIFSSANDLSRFVMALLADGRLDGAQVLSASLFKRLSGEHVAMPGAPEVHYGYGLLNFEDRGVRFRRGVLSALRHLNRRGLGRRYKLRECLPPCSNGLQPIRWSLG